MRSTIRVSGNSTVKETPDQAVVDFSIVSEDDDQSVVVSDLDDVSKTVLSALEKEHGLREEVTTRRFSVDQQSHHGEQKPENNYKGVHSYSVTVTDIEQVGSVIDTLATNGVESLRNVEFNLSHSKYKECREEAIKKAVQDARNEAEVAASAESLEIGTVIEMSVDQTHRNPVSRTSGVMLSSMTKESMSTDVKDEDVSVSVTVKVEYQSK